jgi:hypothetical protein
VSLFVLTCCALLSGFEFSAGTGLPCSGDFPHATKNKQTEERINNGDILSFIAIPPLVLSARIVPD